MTHVVRYSEIRNCCKNSLCRRHDGEIKPDIMETKSKRPGQKYIYASSAALEDYDINTAPLKVRILETASSSTEIESSNSSQSLFDTTSHDDMSQPNWPSTPDDSSDRISPTCSTCDMVKGVHISDELPRVDQFVSSLNKGAVGQQDSFRRSNQHVIITDYGGEVGKPEYGRNMPIYPPQAPTATRGRIWQSINAFRCSECARKLKSRLSQDLKPAQISLSSQALEGSNTFIPES